MNARQVRERQYRRVLATAFGVSAAVHGMVLGWSSFSIPAPAADVAEERETREAPATFEKPAPPTRQPGRALLPRTGTVHRAGSSPPEDR